MFSIFSKYIELVIVLSFPLFYDRKFSVLKIFPLSIDIGVLSSVRIDSESWTLVK